MKVKQRWTWGELKNGGIRICEKCGDCSLEDEMHLCSIPEAGVNEQLALRRKCILDNYGITIENVEFEEWLEIVLSDERLEQWFGEPLEKYILDELAAAELLLSADA